MNLEDHSRKGIEVERLGQPVNAFIHIYRIQSIENPLVDLSRKNVRDGKEEEGGEEGGEKYLRSVDRGGSGGGESKELLEILSNELRVTNRRSAHRLGRRKLRKRRRGRRKEKEEGRRRGRRKEDGGERSTWKRESRSKVSVKD